MSDGNKICNRCNVSYPASIENFFFYNESKNQFRGPCRKCSSSPREHCSVNDCLRRKVNALHCDAHKARLAKHGDLMEDVPIASIAAKGDGSVNKQGYRVHQINRKPKLEHRLVMEEHLGRELLPSENVHHINGIKLDNRIENLELWSVNQPSGQRVEDKISWAKELLSFYEPESLADGY